MPISEKDKSDLKALHSELSPTHHGKVEDYFPLLVLTRRFKFPAYELVHQTLLPGSEEWGINGYYIDRGAKNLYLIAAAWTENHASLRSTMERVSADMQRIFGDTRLQSTSDFERFLSQDLGEVRNVIERVYVQIIFKGDIAAAERSEGLSSRREDIEARQHLVEEFFRRAVEMRVDIVSDRRSRTDVVPAQTFELSIESVLEAVYGPHKMLVGFVRLADLYSIYEVLKYRFFDRNIRASLSPELAPNKRLREAFSSIAVTSTETPDVFAFRHNGVTLAADRVTHDDGKLKIHVPRLLNGAQTVSSLAFFIDETHAGGKLVDRSRLKEIKVLAKIIEADPASDFVVDVTIATNQQNPVQPWALRAMDRRQVDLADKFREDLGIFYSRQEGVFDNLSNDELDELGVSDQRDIKIRPLAQTFLAIQGEIDRMSRLPEVFENAAYYEAAFKPRYSSAEVDARDIILAYKVGLVLRGATRTVTERLPAIYENAVKRGKNLVWALAIQALYNDRRLASDRETFGVTLAKEKGFRERINTIASARVSPILKEVLADPVYDDRLNRQKYEFLRTKELYKRCVQVGVDRWNWTKKAL